jgi:hypothetical protein
MNAGLLFFGSVPDPDPTLQMVLYPGSDPYPVLDPFVCSFLLTKRI